MPYCKYFHSLQFIYCFVLFLQDACTLEKVLRKKRKALGPIHPGVSRFKLLFHYLTPSPDKISSVNSGQNVTIHTFVAQL